MPPLAETLHPAKPDDTLELDELWSFVRCKEDRAWVWVALCRRTRHVVGLWVGGRTESDCYEFRNSIDAAYRGCATVSDFLASYPNVFAANGHVACGKESGETAHVERWNNTLRQRLGRFVRKTLSFSKSWAMHILTLRWFVHVYNTSISVAC